MYDLELIRLGAKNLSTLPPLLFVHGGWHGAWCWQPYFMPFFAGRGYDCAALSFRGHGNSGGKAEIHTHSVQDYVSDISYAVAQFTKPPVIIAHSLGGFVAMHYLAKATPMAAVFLGPVPKQGLSRFVARTALRYPWRFLKINLMQTTKYAVDSTKLVHKFLFSEGINAADLNFCAERLEDESYRAFHDVLWRDLPTIPPKPDLPILLVAANNDYIVRLNDLTATERFLNTKALLIDELSHNMMLDSNWRFAADVILNFLENTLPKEREAAAFNASDA